MGLIQRQGGKNRGGNFCKSLKGGGVLYPPDRTLPKIDATFGNVRLPTNNCGISNRIHLDHTNKQSLGGRKRNEIESRGMDINVGTGT
jgi:hypothetical protein